MKTTVACLVALMLFFGGKALLREMIINLNDRNPNQQRPAWWRKRRRW
jgi:hypothetical protein